MRGKFRNQENISIIPRTLSKQSPSSHPSRPELCDGVEHDARDSLKDTKIEASDILRTWDFAKRAIQGFGWETNKMHVAVPAQRGWEMNPEPLASQWHREISNIRSLSADTYFLISAIAAPECRKSALRSILIEDCATSTYDNCEDSRDNENFAT